MSKLSKRVRLAVVLLLAVFVPSLVIVAASGLRGLDGTRTAADALYRDHLQTSQETALLGRQIDDAYQTAQALLLVADPTQRQALASHLVDQITPQVEIGLNVLEQRHAHDPRIERTHVRELADAWASARPLWAMGGLLGPAPDTNALAPQLRAVFEPVHVLIGKLLSRESHDARIAHDAGIRAYDDGLILIGLVSALAILSGLGLGYFLIRRMLPRTLASEALQMEFAETMQLAGDEGEAHDLLKRHLERAIPQSNAVILNRNNSADRLECVTVLPEHSPLHLQDAEPRSCVAVRTARTYRGEDGHPALLTCQVCGGCPGIALCTPLTVAGEVIGSVLVNHPQHLEVDDERRVHDSITQAAPVLANLRNLAIAELRASTDALTGLPNKRAAQHTIKRMIAQASRTLTPLAALLLDLDHFKQINDRDGHGRGDEVLAAVGAALRAAIRDSDFAARNGGDEFLILLSNTDLDGARVLAEKIKTAIKDIFVANIDSPITASIGLAVFPEHATDATTLERAADRALYTAKARGRNRVETTDAHDPTLVTT